LELEAAAEEENTNFVSILISEVCCGFNDAFLASPEISKIPSDRNIEGYQISSPRLRGLPFIDVRELKGDKHDRRRALHCRRRRTKDFRMYGEMSQL
jgi:hypothetical protein